jgi:catechol 2,3-dioxygenase-like lactoylglutathione lyase family enzyme
MLTESATPTAATAPQRRSSPIHVRKFGHLVYEVSDIERSVKFWTEVMNFKVSDVNEKGMVFLRYGSDHHGIGLKPGESDHRAKPADGLIIDHLAMEVANVDALFEAREYLRERGVPIVFEGRKGPGGNYSINFLDPDGHEFELYTDIDQIDESGRTRPPSQFRRAKSLEEAVANPLPLRW